MNKESEAIFIWTYPNTEEKISILKKCIMALRNIDIKIILVSNMNLPKDVSSLADDFIIGENQKCRFQDFYTDDEIDIARNSTRYLTHFAIDDNNVISYIPFGYGRGSTYHWSTLSQNILTLNYSISHGISKMLILEGDVILEKADSLIIPEIFWEMDAENLDFIISIQFETRTQSGNAWFTTSAYWSKVCVDFSPEDFLTTTYPDWSAENYILAKMKLAGGRGNVLTWGNNPFERGEVPEKWRVVEKRIPENIKFPKSINLFFSETHKIGLSSSQDNKKIDITNPLSFIQAGVGLRLPPVFFIRNAGDRKILANASIFNGSQEIFNLSYNLLPDCWCWNDLNGLEENSYCIFQILFDDDFGNQISYTDRFGLIGAF
jgi:hypothetical protein